MKRIVFLLILLIIGFGRGAYASEDCSFRGEAGEKTILKRGINLSRWWESDRNQSLSSDEIRNLGAMGLDFVRLPVDPQWILQSDDNEKDENRRQLRCDIVTLLNENLAVIVDLHASGKFQRELPEDASAAAARLEEVWKQMEPVLVGLPPGRVFLGLFNEPRLETKHWWKIQENLVGSLRNTFPLNPMVVASAPDSGPWDLGHMKPYADKNVIYDFHFYQPMLFTHHAADWLSNFSPEDKTTHIPYPVMPDTPLGEGKMKDYVANAWGRDVLKSFVDKIAKWAKTNKVTIACLEFGVYRPYVDEQSRVNWVTDMREALEDKGVAWAMWEYRGSFGLVGANGNPDDGIIKALGLNISSQP